MLVLGFLYSKSTTIVQQKTTKKKKNQHVKQLRFSLNTTNASTLKIVHSNRLFTAMTPSFCSLTDTKQSLQYTIKTHLSGLPMPKFERKYELYTSKPSRLHETVQQKCYCKISYGTTFDITRKQSRSGATPFDSRL